MRRRDLAPLRCIESRLGRPRPRPLARGETRAAFCAGSVLLGERGSVCDEGHPSPALGADTCTAAAAEQGPEQLRFAGFPATNEVSAYEKLSTAWAGWEDDFVPEDELARRKAERAAAREAQRKRDREHALQLGFLPDAHFRRAGTGKHIRCERLEEQLDGIHKRRGNIKIWNPERTAMRTMENVAAQCLSVRDLGDRSDMLPSSLRGLYPTLTRTQIDVLRALTRAYLAGALGILEFQPVLASDLRMSERQIRRAVNGEEGRPPGLVELGLARRRQTWRRGQEGRPSDHHYLLLQAGPKLVEILLPLAYEQRGRKLSNAGYTRGTARQAARGHRKEGRRARMERVSQVIERRNRWRTGEVQDRCTGSQTRCAPGPQNPPLKSAAQRAVFPVPPPPGEGVGELRPRRGKPPALPQKNASLRDTSFAPASPPPSLANGSDFEPTPENSHRDRARALDEVAEVVPKNLEIWRKRKRYGARIPDKVDEQLFNARIAEAKAALFPGGP